MRPKGKQTEAKKIEGRRTKLGRHGARGRPNAALTQLKIFFFMKK